MNCVIVWALLRKTDTCAWQVKLVLTVLGYLGRASRAPYSASRTERDWRCDYGLQLHQDIVPGCFGQMVAAACSRMHGIRAVGTCGRGGDILDTLLTTVEDSVSPCVDNAMRMSPCPFSWTYRHSVSVGRRGALPWVEGHEGGALFQSRSPMHARHGHWVHC